MKQHRKALLLACLLASAIWSRPEEDDEEEDDEEYMNPKNRGKPKNILENCLDEKEFLTLYTKVENNKMSVLNILMTPEYPNSKEIYNKEGSNKSFKLFSQRKRSYQIDPSEVVTFFERVFSRYKKDNVKLSWANIIEGNPGSGFINQMNQCIFDNVLGLRKSNFLNALSADKFGYLSEVLQDVDKLQTILSKESIEFGKGIYAGFYQLSRALHFLISKKYFVLNFDYKSIGIRISDSFPVFRIKELHRITSKCQIKEFEDSEFYEKALESKPDGKDKKDFLEENPHICFNASIVSLLQTFEKMYKRSGKPLSLRSCFENPKNSADCPTDISKVLVADGTLASELSQIYKKEKITDNSFVDNAESLILFFGKLLSKEFKLKTAMSDSNNSDETEDEDDEFRPSNRKSDKDSEPNEELDDEENSNIDSESIVKNESIQIPEKQTPKISKPKQKEVDTKPDQIKVDAKPTQIKVATKPDKIKVDSKKEGIGRVSDKAKAVIPETNEQKGNKKSLPVRKEVGNRQITPKEEIKKPKKPSLKGRLIAELNLTPYANNSKQYFEYADQLKITEHFNARIGANTARVNNDHLIQNKNSKYYEKDKSNSKSQFRSKDNLKLSTRTSNVNLSIVKVSIVPSSFHRFASPEARTTVDDISSKRFSRSYQNLLDGYSSEDSGWNSENLESNRSPIEI
jgi:hypothetical protein